MSWGQASGPSPSTPSGTDLERPIASVPAPVGFVKPPISNQEFAAGPFSRRPAFGAAPSDTTASPLKRSVHRQSKMTPPRSLFIQWERRESEKQRRVGDSFLNNQNV